MSDYSSENIREIYERHFVTVYRVCFMYLRNCCLPRKTQKVGNYGINRNKAG